MITFTPINKKIQETLFKKMSMLDRDSRHSIGEIVSPGGNGKPSNYMNTRSTWLRMISLTPPKYRAPVMLMGGEADSRGNIVSNIWGSKNYTDVPEELSEEKTREIMGPLAKGQSRTEKYRDILVPASTTEEITYGKYYKDGEQPYRPMPGIKDVSIEFRGGGMKLGATRTAEISWTCWTWQDLDRLMPHFLHHGKTVFLDWGWSGIGELKDVIPYPIFKKNDDGKLEFIKDSNPKSWGIYNISLKIPKYILEKGNGHYDGLLGKVQNFTWTVRDDGGFDCTTTLVSLGISALQQTLKTDHLGQMAGLPLWIDKSELINLDIKNELVKSAYSDETKKLLASHLKQAKYTVGQWYEGGTNDSYPMTSFLSAPFGDFASLSPYFTFSAYMKDLKSQLARILGPNGSKQVRESGHVLWLLQYGFGGVNPKLYCTWGWFEDNVLSRFFSLIGNNNNLISSVRSIETKYKADGTVLGKESVKIRNDKYMIITDTSKFLLIKSGDALSNILINQMRSGITEDDVSGMTQFYQMNAHPPAYTSEQKSKDLEDFSSKNHVYFNPSEETEKARGKTDEDLQEGLGICKEKQGFLRNVYFSVEYLQEKCIDVKNLQQIIENVWNGFSSEYGGIFNFKIDFSDDQNTIMVKDSGWTASSVKFQLKNLSRRKKAGEEVDKFDGLFTFPIWEKSSMVKSQNLSAKLPSRMQLAAMYASNKVNTVKDEAESDSDELAAIAWGKLLSPTPEEDGSETLSELRKKNLKNLVTGNLSVPYERNTSFGNAVADPNEDLVMNPRDEQGNMNINDPLDRGTYIYPSILTRIVEEQKEEAQRRYKVVVKKKTKEGEEEVSFDIKKLKEMKDKWAEYFRLNYSKGIRYSNFFGESQNIINVGKNKADKVESLYYMIIEHNTGWIKMGTLAKKIMQSNLKGIDGIVGQSDPIIPVELELDIDGIGGIFPGNSFQSSYLPSRYRKMACFQVVGVSQKIDSTDWSTTIKGQIRVSLESEIDEERAGLKKSGEDVEGGHKFKQQTKPTTPSLPKPKKEKALPKPDRPDVPLSSEDIWDELVLGDLELDKIDLQEFIPWDNPPPMPGPVTTDIDLSPTLLTNRQLEGIDAIPGSLTATVRESGISLGGGDLSFGITVQSDFLDPKNKTGRIFSILISENLFESLGEGVVDDALNDLFNKQLKWYDLSGILVDPLGGLDTEYLYSHIRELIMKSGGSKIEIKISPTGG